MAYALQQVTHPHVIAIVAADHPDLQQPEAVKSTAAGSQVTSTSGGSGEEAARLQAVIR